MVAVWVYVQKSILYVIHPTNYFILRRLSHDYFLMYMFFFSRWFFNAVLNQSTWSAFFRNLNLNCGVSLGFI